MKMKHTAIKSEEVQTQIQNLKGDIYSTNHNGTLLKLNQMNTQK